MTNNVYPSNILGLSFNVVRTPDWNTNVQRAVSQKRSTIALQLYPVIHFELDYELLRDDLTVSDLKSLVGLFNACQGQFNTFLFSDPDFNTIPSTAPMQFAVADGTVGPFQLTATYANSGGPGYAEMIQNLNNVPTLFANGVFITSGRYSIGPTGLVTFASGQQPASGAVPLQAGAEPVAAIPLQRKAFRGPS